MPSLGARGAAVGELGLEVLRPLLFEMGLLFLYTATWSATTSASNPRSERTALGSLKAAPPRPHVCCQ